MGDIKIRGFVWHAGYTGQIGEGKELVARFYYRMWRVNGNKDWTEWMKVPIETGSGPGNWPLYSDAREWLADMMEKHGHGERYM